MAQVKITNVQYPMVWNVEVNPDDVGNELVIDVPPGFVLTGLVNVIREVFNGTTPTYSVVDNKASPTTYIASATSGTAGTTNAIAATLYSEFPSGGKLRILYVVASGTTTTGRADVIVQGIVRGRQNERVGANIAT